MLTPGSVLVGKYEIIRVLGEGGFGQIYLGHDVLMDRDVAIKELLRDAAAAQPDLWQDYQVRFRKEAQVMSQFAHPNIVAVHALETDASGDLYLVLEFVGGGSVKQALEESGRLGIDRALSIAIDISQAIDAMFRRDIVHRDIKPSNILIARDGTAKLTDFGVAQVGHETRRTQEAMGHPGTPAYKSPEQATTTGYLDERSDLYALGLVLYEMLTGHLYVRNRVPPNRYNPQVPQALTAIVMKSLEEHPSDRYQTAAEMRQDLQRVQQQDTLGQMRVMLRNTPRQGLAVAGLLALFLIIAGGALRLGSAWGNLNAQTGQNVAVVTALPTALAASPAAAALQPLAQPGLPLVPLAVASATPERAPGLIMVDRYEPDDETPAALAVGETQGRSFDHEGDIDRVTFRAKKGRTYVVSTSNLSAGVDTQLEVVAGGRRYTNDDVSPGTMASQVVFDALEDGTVVVTVSNQDLYGPERIYDLSVITGDVVPTARPAAGEGTGETPTPDGTEYPSSTPRPTFTHGPTATLRPTSTPRATTTPRPTSTRRPTWTRVPTATRTRTPTRTRTVTPTPTRTTTGGSPTNTTAPPTSTTAPPTNTTAPSTTEPTKTQVPERTPLPTNPPGPPVE